MHDASKAKGNPAATNAASTPQIDTWMVLDLVARKWIWLVVGCVVGGLLAFVAADKLIGPKFTASAQLLRYEIPGASEFLKSDAPMSAETFGGLILAPELLRRVGQSNCPPIPPETLVKQIKVDPDDESDLVSVALAASTPQQAVQLLNTFLTNAVDYLRDLQSQQVRAEADLYIGKQVAQMDQDIAELDQEFRLMAMPPVITNKVAQVGGQLNQLSHSLNGRATTPAVVAMETERLNQAMGELASLTMKYTDLHPLVQQKEAEVKALETKLTADSTNVAPQAEAPAAAAAPVFQMPVPTINPEVDIIRAKLLSL
jgi:uncharacterized protein involved in exopolysaccharide biosynthesis